jgi:hypothetical protein
MWILLGRLVNAFLEVEGFEFVSIFMPLCNEIIALGLIQSCVQFVWRGVL